ncbi:hypothetical protein ACI1US_00899 [Leucobacter sp. BZR 635]
MTTENTATTEATVNATAPLALSPGTVIQLPEAALQLAELPTDEIRAGAPQAGSRKIAAGPGLNIGIWEMTTGTAVDVEVDECFLVLEGRATVTVQPSDAAQDPRVMELRAGTIGRLAAGMHTEWVVHETLRKVYLFPATA